jgi:hypothetical protein
LGLFLHSDLAIHGEDDEHDGGFLGPLLAGLASGALSSLFSGAVNKGVAKKAGVEPLGSGLYAPGGHGLKQIGTGMDYPIKKKTGKTKMSQGNHLASGLYQLGMKSPKQGRGSTRMQAFQDSLTGQRVI